MSRPSASRGFTLVEILISVVIGLFLTAGMIQMYVANKQTYRLNEALARMQENGRYALELMGADLRMAGFWGCGQGKKRTNHVNPDDPEKYNPVWHDFEDGLGGRDSPGGPVGDPDELTIKGAVGNGLIVQGLTLETDPIAVSGSRTDVEKAICGYTYCLDNNVADMVLVSDCKGGDIFQVTSLASADGISAVGFRTDHPNFEKVPEETPGNKANTLLSNVYDETATLHVLRVGTYDVRGTSGDRGLFLRENGANAQEVVEGVENMQIAYGEDTNGDGTANRYVPRLNVTDMGAVVSVRISLLLASPEDNLTDTQQAIVFDGATVNCPSRHICQVMSSTFALRNRAR